MKYKAEDLLKGNFSRKEQIKLAEQEIAEWTKFLAKLKKEINEK